MKLGHSKQQGVCFIHCQLWCKQGYKGDNVRSSLWWEGEQSEVPQNWVAFANHRVRTGDEILGIETYSTYKVQVSPRLATSKFVQLLLKFGNMFFILH